MAASTTRSNAGMVHGTGGESTGALMAGLASRCSLNMGTWLTFGGTAIVAIGATAGDTGVVHCRAGKTAGALMAGLTGRRGLDMGTWLTFSG